MEKAFLFIFGLAIGSFLNVLIDRLPKGRSIMGRSHCDHCKKTLKWFELIPIVSFVIQGGRSHCCHKKLSFQYPLVELLTGFLFVFSFYYFNIRISDLFRISDLVFGISLLCIMSCLIVIFFADLKFQIIPDSIQIVLFLSSIIYRLLSNTFMSVLFDGIVVMALIFLVWLVTKARGMGFGDVKLAFIMGVLLGWQKGLVALYIAFITGAVYGLILIVLKKKKLKSKIAFGPFLIIGTMIMLFCGKLFLTLVYKLYFRL